MHGEEWMMIVIFLCELGAPRQRHSVQGFAVVLRQQRPARCLQQRPALGVVAKGTGQLQRTDQLTGNRRAAVGGRVLWQCTPHRRDQATHALRRRLAYLGRLARHFRGERRHRATGFELTEMAIGQVAFHQGTQGTGAARLTGGDALSDTRRTVLGGGREGVASKALREQKWA
jgi:hypothetical protein